MPDYEKIWGTNSSLTPYEFSDSDYLKGWETIGSVPPARTQFDALQRLNDQKTKDLNTRTSALETTHNGTHRMPATTYTEGTFQYTDGLPNGWYLECSVEGVTRNGAIELPTSYDEGDSFVDGTVMWTIRKIASTHDIEAHVDTSDQRKPSTAYPAKSIAYLAALPTGWYLEATTGGITDSGDITLPSPVVENATITDGTVVWTIRVVASTADIPAPVDISGKADITGANMVYHKDVITTSGTYTAPVTGLYKITVKGGGGGGAGGFVGSSSRYYEGASGGEGGTTIGYEYISVGQTVTIVIGAGGTGGQGGSANQGADGGDSTVTINGNTYTGGGGGGGMTAAGLTGYQGGKGGSGTIPGCSGNPTISAVSASIVGESGGGAGGGRSVFNATPADVDGVNGGGGAGGSVSNNSAWGGASNGGAGGNGYVWFEYYTPSSN